MYAEQGKSQKVLVADDNLHHCRLIRKILENDGFEVTEMHTGEAALKACETIHPDLVILDSMLPNRCGLECLHFIKHHPDLQHIHVMMCSARNDIRYVLSCMEAGAEAFVFKPFEADKFRNRVQHLLGKTSRSA